jgi:transposase
MLTGQSNTVDAGPEVLSSPKRRRFSVQDKRRLVREYEATPSGERGAFLRRNGLYSSYIDNWRKLVESAAIQALEPQKRGPKPQPKPDPELERLRRENALLKVKLSRAEKVIEVQKKISEILGVDQTLPDELKEENS